jgi:VanZ family protein
MRPASWIPPILWMGLIFWFSSGSFSAQVTGAMLLPLLEWLWPWSGSGLGALLHGAARKLAHLTEYAILAMLWWRALADRREPGRWRPFWLAFGITVVWAVVDELHQATVHSRTGSAADVVLDATGGAIALTALALARGSVGRAARFVLATGLVGALLFLGLHYALGVGLRWLWAIAPGAWLIAVLVAYVRTSLGVATLPPGA